MNRVMHSQLTCNRSLVGSASAGCARVTMILSPGAPVVVSEHAWYAAVTAARVAALASSALSGLMSSGSMLPVICET